MKLQGKGNSEPVTVGGPSPADFPLGSVESRAAARAAVEAMNSKPPDFTVHMKFTRAEWEEFKERLQAARGGGEPAGGGLTIEVIPEFTD